LEGGLRALTGWGDVAGVVPPTVPPPRARSSLTTRCTRTRASTSRPPHPLQYRRVKRPVGKLPSNPLAARVLTRSLQVLNEDMDEETLREIFKECLRDAPAHVSKEAGPGGLKAALAKLFKRGPRVGSGGAEATEQEIGMVRPGRLGGGWRWVGWRGVWGC
jgi:hypothetical protein